MGKLGFIFSWVWDFLKPIVTMLAQEGGKVLAQAALDAVRIVAISLAEENGGAKREAAFRMVQNSLKKKGIELGTSAINMAIEVAVQKIKGETK